MASAEKEVDPATKSTTVEKKAKAKANMGERRSARMAKGSRTNQATKILASAD